MFFSHTKKKKTNGKNLRNTLSNWTTTSQLALLVAQIAKKKNCNENEKENFFYSFQCEHNLLFYISMLLGGLFKLY